MHTWDDLKKGISSVPQEELKQLKLTATLVSSIIKKRKELGWTQEQLADAAGMKQAAIARF